MNFFAGSSFTCISISQGQGWPCGREAGAASLPRRPGTVGEERLSVYRFRLSDAVENVFYGSIAHREKIVGNLELYLCAVLHGNHTGKAVESNRAGDRFGKDYRVGCLQELRAERGDNTVWFVVHAGYADYRGITPRHTALLGRSDGEPPKSLRRYRRGMLGRSRTTAMAAVRWEKRRKPA